MSLFLYALPCSAVVLEGLLLWRLSRDRVWTRYPHLTVFVVFDFLCNAILFPIHRYRPDWFAELYWRIASISLFLRFLVNWEFFRVVFAGRSTLHVIACKLLLTVVLCVLPALVVVRWMQASYD